MIPSRLVLLLALGPLLLTGCVSTRRPVTVQTASPAQVGLGWDARRATVWVASDTTGPALPIEVRDLRLQRDSTSWMEAGSRRTVGTDRVTAFEVVERQAGPGLRSGLLVGLGLSGLLIGAGVVEDLNCERSDGEACGWGGVLAVAAAVPLTLVFTAAGMVVGATKQRTVRYVLRPR